MIHTNSQSDAEIHPAASKKPARGLGSKVAMSALFGVGMDFLHIPKMLDGRYGRVAIDGEKPWMI